MPKRINDGLDVLGLGPMRLFRLRAAIREGKGFLGDLLQASRAGWVVTIRGGQVYLAREGQDNCEGEG